MSGGGTTLGRISPSYFFQPCFKLSMHHAKALAVR